MLNYPKISVTEIDAIIHFYARLSFNFSEAAKRGGVYMYIFLIELFGGETKVFYLKKVICLFFCVSYFKNNL